MPKVWKKVRRRAITKTGNVSCDVLIFIIFIHWSWISCYLANGYTNDWWKKWNCSGNGITVAEVPQLLFILGKIKSNWRTSATVIPFPEQFHFFFISHSCTHLLDSVNLMVLKCTFSLFLFLKTFSHISHNSSVFLARVLFVISSIFLDL